MKTRHRGSARTLAILHRIQSTITMSTHTTETRYELPQDTLFTRLLTLASHASNSQKPAIVDLNTEPPTRKSLAEVLSDAIHLRAHIYSKLSPAAVSALSSKTEEVYIHLLAPGGYEFTVGILAILSLGAACSPLSVVQPVSELSYYARKSRAVAVVSASTAYAIGQKLADEITSTTKSGFAHVSVSSITGRHGRSSLPFIEPSQIVIGHTGYADLNGPGIVIFTSGTTGPPKAAVLPRASISDGALSFAEQLGLSSEDTLLHLLPVHHATGIWVSFFPFLQSGCTIEFKPGSFSPEWTWNRWLKGGLSHFSGVPTIYMRMMRYYQDNITKLTEMEKHRYAEGARKFKVMMCGTSALPKPINDFWTSVRRGRKIVQRYGSTEMGIVFNMPFEGNEDVPDGSVGEVTLGVDVKLSAKPGKEGEVLVKSFNQFSKYLHDPQATEAAFDENGYFCSGDIARKEGKYYFIVGRASVDIIKSGGYKISALDVEREILALPYIMECMVVGVSDEEFGQRVGCVITIRDDETANRFLEERGRSRHSLKLDDLRKDIRERLAGYKLPTLLRVVPGELPKSGTGKVQKKTLGPAYFPVEYATDPGVQVWNRRRSLPQSKL